MDVQPPRPPGDAEPLNPPLTIPARPPRGEQPGAATDGPDALRGEPRSEARDEVVVSLEARRLARAAREPGLDEETRARLIAELRSQVEAGTYRPDPQALARLLQERGET